MNNMQPTRTIMPIKAQLNGKIPYMKPLMDNNGHTILKANNLRAIPSKFIQALPKPAPSYYAYYDLSNYTHYELLQLLNQEMHKLELTYIEEIHQDPYLELGTGYEPIYYGEWVYFLLTLAYIISEHTYNFVYHEYEALVKQKPFNNEYFSGVLFNSKGARIPTLKSTLLEIQRDLELFYHYYRELYSNDK
jgi:hypothetical protein